MYAAFFQAIQSLRNPLVFIVFVQVPEVRDENGFTFRGEALHDGLLIVGGRLTLFERDRPHRALPDTGAEAITVKVADQSVAGLLRGNRRCSFHSRCKRLRLF